jgi:alpha-ketoglutarate-dependent taurine dioxygenase
MAGLSKPKEALSMKTEPITEQFGTQVLGESPADLDAVDKESVVDLFKERGALWFRGFNVSLERFNDFTASFSTDYMNYRGGGYVRKEVDSGKDSTLLSVRYDHGREEQETFGLPLHGEMYYTDRRPVLLWFYCVRPADADGETTICDGSQIYRALRPEHRELLESKRLNYLRRYREEEWQKIYQADDIEAAAAFAREGGIKVKVMAGEKELHTEYVYPGVITSRWGEHRVFINNMLTVVWQERMLGLTKSIVRFEDGSEIPDELVQDVRKVQQELVLPIAWGKGDFVMLDNTRVLHGRREFKDPDREVFLRMVRSVPF